jgi:hypothetical protein
MASLREAIHVKMRSPFLGLEIQRREAMAMLIETSVSKKEVFGTPVAAGISRMAGA